MSDRVDIPQPSDNDAVISGGDGRSALDLASLRAQLERAKEQDFDYVAMPLSLGRWAALLDAAERAGAAEKIISLWWNDIGITDYDDHAGMSWDDQSLMSDAVEKYVDQFGEPARAALDGEGQPR